MTIIACPKTDRERRYEPGLQGSSPALNFKEGNFGGELFNCRRVEPIVAPRPRRGSTNYNVHQDRRHERRLLHDKAEARFQP